MLHQHYIDMKGMLAALLGICVRVSYNMPTSINAETKAQMEAKLEGSAISRENWAMISSFLIISLCTAFSGQSKLHLLSLLLYLLKELPHKRNFSTKKGGIVLEKNWNA